MREPDELYIADLPPLRKFDADNFTLHANWDKFTDDFVDGHSLKVMKAAFKEPNIVFDSTMKRQNNRWVSWASADLGDGLTRPSNIEYLAALGEKLKAYDLEARKGLFANSNIIHSEGNIICSVDLYDDGINMYNSGEKQFAQNYLDGLTQKLVAPKIGDIKTGHYEFFKRTIQAQLLAMTALAECITDKKANPTHNLILPMDGAVYDYDEDKGIATRVRESITLTSGESHQNIEDNFSEERALDSPRGVMIDDVIGSQSMHDQLKQAVKAFKHSDTMKKWGVSMSQGILLYGPPGTGKTMAAQALANEIDGELWEVRATDILDKWMGNSEKNIQAIFDQAVDKKTPTVMMWDEIDSILGSEKEGESSSASSKASIRGIFKRETAKLAMSAPNVVLVGATNHKDKIDEAILRAGRFDTQIYMDLPNETSRAQILSSKIASIVSEFSADGHMLYSADINIQKLAESTDGWSGADLVEVLMRAQRRKAFEEAEGKQPDPISQDCLEYEIKLYRRQRSA